MSSSTPILATPGADIDIDAALARRLLAAQHPDLADLPVALFDTGWDNVMFRLGDALAVRLPRRASAAELIAREQRWLPILQAQLPLPVPTPVRMGVPAEGYPWPWSVIPWLPGRTADQAPPAAGQGARLAAFLRALHQPAPVDAPANPVRGVPLANRAPGVEERLRRLETSGSAAITPLIWTLWNEALAAPRHGTATWLHGDLHARNVLVDEAGALSGVIDWSDLAAGDPATDLAAVWMLLPTAAERQQAMAAYGRDDAALWARARGWAVLFGALLLETGLQDHPRHARMGALTLERLGE